eukprot:356630-Chlamydomonas_euryale.AAC.1
MLRLGRVIVPCNLHRCLATHVPCWPVLLECGPLGARSHSQRSRPLAASRPRRSRRLTGQCCSRVGRLMPRGTRTSMGCELGRRAARARRQGELQGGRCVQMAQQSCEPCANLASTAIRAVLCQSRWRGCPVACRVYSRHTQAESAPCNSNSPTQMSWWARRPRAWVEKKGGFA